MTIVMEDDTDLRIGQDGQPIAGADGDFDTVYGKECWEQDLRLECGTEEGELFYEDEDGDESYGFGLLDYAHAENDEFTQMEIQQRIRGKLSKRTYLDPGKTRIDTTYSDGIYRAKLSVSPNDSNDEYNMELSTEDVEVEDT